MDPNVKEDAQAKSVNMDEDGAQNSSIRSQTTIDKHDKRGSTSGAENSKQECQASSAASKCLAGLNWRQDPCSVDIDTLPNEGVTTKLRTKDHSIVAEQMGSLYSDFVDDRQPYVGFYRPTRWRS